jgi:hypothetical protein
MNTGIEILLKRMESHPEDFDYNLTKNMSRWYRLVDHALADELTTEEEEKALKDMLFKLRRDRFTEMVMKELAGVDETSEDPKSLEDVIKQYRATGISSVGQTLASSTGQSQFSNTTGAVRIPNGTITLGNTSLNEEQLKHMKAHMDALNKVEVRKKATLR